MMMPGDKDPVREFLAPYRALRDAVARWYYSRFEHELVDGKVVTTKHEVSTEVEEAVVHAFQELEFFMASFVEREIVRMIDCGEAVDVADAIMVGTTETQLRSQGLNLD